MVKHIVLYTLKEGVDKTEAVKLIASVLEPLVGKIPGLLHLEIRQAFNGMDYALYSEFESREALKRPGGHHRGCLHRSGGLQRQRSGHQPDRYAGLFHHDDGDGGLRVQCAAGRACHPHGRDRQGNGTVHPRAA